MTSTTPYVDALQRHARARVAHLTVPGHKGGAAAPARLTDLVGGEALAADLPLLLPGIDRPAVGDPVGSVPPLEQAQAAAAAAWGAARTWFLTGGATQGNLAACLALALAGGAGPGRGGPVVVQRSAHTSVFNGLALAGLDAAYVSPQVDEVRGIAHAVTPAMLAVALARTPDARAVLLTSPTYHGTAADLRSLIRVAHARGAAVIVDESWGAHLRFSTALPIDALSAGADLVISSTHKHLGSLGGSAMLHLGRHAPDWLDAAAIERALALITSTSPSSLLLASLDAARARAEEQGAELLARAVTVLGGLRAAIASVPGFAPLGVEQIGRHGVAALDPLRLCVDVRASGWTGQQLASLARSEHGLELELAQPAVVVACFGLGEGPADRGARLVALFEDAVRRGPRAFDRRLLRPTVRGVGAGPVARPELGLREALWAPQLALPFAEAAGAIAAEALIPYPPGIPLALPGERLRAEVLGQVADWVARGGAMRGLADPSATSVRVVAGSVPAESESEPAAGGERDRSAAMGAEGSRSAPGSGPGASSALVGAA